MDSFAYGLAQIGSVARATRTASDPRCDVADCSFPKASADGMMCEPPHKERHMATNLAIDPELLERALRVSGERTKKAAVTKALHEFIARREQRRVAELLGKLEWDSAFDHKAERTRRA